MSIIEQLEKRKKLLSYLNSPSNEEVFTPAKLVEEMLDRLPPEVWSNPNLLWCDPCAKSGVFILEVIIRLMRSLPIKDETERYKHIINNMVKAYVNVERNKWLVSKMIYGSKDDVNKVGIIEDINKIKIEDMPKFDVIVGNPPYQSLENRQSKGNKVKAYKQPLWALFIQKGIELIKNDAYLMLITPPTWLAGTYDIRKGRVKLIDIFKKYNLKYLNVSKDIKKYFSVASSFSVFLMKKSKNYNGTELITDEGKMIIDIKDIDMMPRDFNSLAILINNKTLFNKNIPKLQIKSVGIFYKPEDRSNVKTATHKYKAYVIGGNLDKAHYAYYEKPDNYRFNKIIIPKGGADKFRPYVDFDKLGIANNQNWIVKLDKNDNKESVISYMNSKLIKFLIQNNRYSGFVTTIVAKNIPKVDFTKNWTDKDIYKYFNLTSEEINYIESHVN
jgi:site-specific DNA-methyltransferase (adenine-specific)